MPLALFNCKRKYSESVLLATRNDLVNDSISNYENSRISHKEIQTKTTNIKHLSTQTSKTKTMEKSIQTTPLTSDNW